MSIDRRHVQETGGPFVLYDDRTGETTFALPCWRCGRNLVVQREEFERANHCTCPMCAREIQRRATAVARSE